MGFMILRKGRKVKYLLFLAVVIFFVRWTKGAGFLDAFSFLSRPFWPGPAQSEWIDRSIQFEYKARISLLEEDNQRLRELLSLQKLSGNDVVSAAVIARRTNGWWQQLDLGKGKSSGVNPGDSVVGPGGLIGIIHSATDTTSRVRLLTAPGSRVGVWVPRTKKHGILIGLGTNRPYVNFLDREPAVIPGDLLSTSPASTLLPPNIPIGVIQSINTEKLSAPTAIVQLMAAPEAIDWVQIKINGK